MRKALIFSTIAVSLLYSCNRNYFEGKSFSKNDVIKWEVVFEKNTSAEERYKAISLLEKYILDGFYSENKDIVLNGCKFNFNFKNLSDRQAITIGFSISYAGMNAVSTVKPPIGPPKHEIITRDISPFIENIRSVQEKH